MASRTVLFGIQSYDSDGDLDSFIKGSQWIDWYAWRRETSTMEQIEDALRKQFELVLRQALDMGERHKDGASARRLVTLTNSLLASRPVRSFQTRYTMQTGNNIDDLSVKHAKIILHASGLSQSSKQFRTYYCCDSADPDLNALVTAGYFTGPIRSGIVAADQAYFYLTKQGVAAATQLSRLAHREVRDPEPADEEEEEAEEEEAECEHCGWKVSQCICDAPGGDL